MANNYLRETRPEVVCTRLTSADRQLVEAAASAVGARSVAGYVADRLVRAARRDLVGSPEEEREEPRAGTVGD